MDRDSLLNRLTILDFMAVDLHLYLDTHEDDEEAIEKYNGILIEADAVRTVYEENYGPLCSYRSMSKTPFTWIDDPWPWNRDFNYDVSKEGF